MKILYKTVGILSVTIGVIGAFVPLLPTTCFILLAAWCFSKSSPEWHHAMRKNRWFGEALVRWEETRTIPVKAQRIAIGSIVLSGAYSLIVLDNVYAQASVLLILALALWGISQIRVAQS